MRRTDLDIFGSTCADSTTYTDLSDVLQLTDSLSDIGRLFSVGKARVGYTKKEQRPIWVYLYESMECPVAICVKAANLELWESGCSMDAEDLAWMYINVLSHLATNLRVRSTIIRSVSTPLLY